LIELQKAGLGFERLDRNDCIQRYLDPLNSGRDLIVVTNLTTNALTINDGTSLIYTFQEPINGVDWDTDSLWICMDWNHLNNVPCTFQYTPIIASNWTVATSQFYDEISYNEVVFVPVEYCLSGGPNPRNTDCGFHWSISIMVLVCALNMVNIMSIYCITKWSKEPCLVSRTTCFPLVLSLS
jgi:hypothetical protein